MHSRMLSWGMGAIVLVAAALAVRSAPAEGPAPVPASAPATRTFHFTYSVKVPKPAEGSQRMEIWIPVPLEDELQKVADLKVDAAVPTTIETEKEYGNKMVHAVVENPTAEVSIAWSATVTRTADEGQGRGPTNPRFLQADHLVPLDGQAKSLAGHLAVTDASKPVRARAKAIYDHVLSTMVYDKQTPGFGKGDFDRACKVGKGNCTDFHALFIGIGRAAGIPVRFTMGMPLSTDAKGAPGGYHCWAHFLDGTSWVPVDISEAQKIDKSDPAKAQWYFGHLDADRVALTVGRDVNLAPKQQGPALLFLAYPYVEVDGKAVDVPKEARSFAFENVAN